MIDICELKGLIAELSSPNPFGEKVLLVGATKTVPADIINQAIENGLKIVAENKVQEFRGKTDLIKGAHQHFIGHLQTNKVKYLIGKVDLIQSVDSIHLAQIIDYESAKKNTVTDILIEVNVGGELSKSGFNLQNVKDAVKEISAMQNIRIKGLMAMLPKGEEHELIPLCKKMRKVYDELKNQGYGFEFLSMGMSADYKTAIQCGSNMVRIGSRIFGKRDYEVK